MDSLKKNIMIILYFLSFFVINCLLYYYDLISVECFRVFKLIDLLLIFIYSGFILYKKNKLYLSFVFSFIFILLSIVFCIINKRFTMKIFIYYFIIIFSAYIGSLIRKVKKSSN